MIKKIDFGKTNFNDLHQVFKYATQEEFETIGIKERLNATITTL